MASKASYTITTSNNVSEKEALQFLIDSDINFINPSKESRKKIMEMLSIEDRHKKAFDLVLIPGHTNLEAVINLNQTLVELKTTKKKLLNNPAGFFFGATQSEFDLATKLGDKYQFCFVSLHPDSLSYKLLTLHELNSIIRTKRIQYQINL